MQISTTWLRHVGVGAACLLTAVVAHAQEQRANLQTQGAAPNAVQPVIFENWGSRVRYNADPNFYNPYAYYEPGVYNNPNYQAPNRGYTSFSATGCQRCGLWGRLQFNNPDNVARRAEFGHRVRCSLAFLRPLTYWDLGLQKDMIAVDPGYTHPNDQGQIYSAQGYGMPVSVPLAPGVRQQYNYGWGLPSSRLTPLSSPVARY